VSCTCKHGSFTLEHALAPGKVGRAAVAGRLGIKISSCTSVVLLLHERHAIPVQARGRILLRVVERESGADRHAQSTHPSLRLLGLWSEVDGSLWWTQVMCARAAVLATVLGRGASSASAVRRVFGRTIGRGTDGRRPRGSRRKGHVSRTRREPTS
jgi:hypothetical protein